MDNRAIHLDERWNECIAPSSGFTAWPHGGLIDSLIKNPDISPAISAVAVIIATYAAEGHRVIPTETIVACTPDRAATLAALGELADRRYIALTDGER